MRVLLGILLFISGAFLGGMTQTSLVQDWPMWQWIIMLIVAFALCGAGWEMIRKKKSSE